MTNTGSDRKEYQLRPGHHPTPLHRLGTRYYERCAHFHVVMSRHWAPVYTVQCKQYLLFFTHGINFLWLSTPCALIHRNTSIDALDSMDEITDIKNERSSDTTISRRHIQWTFVLSIPVCIVFVEKSLQNNFRTRRSVVKLFANCYLSEPNPV